MKPHVQGYDARLEDATRVRWWVNLKSAAIARDATLADTVIPHSAGDAVYLINDFNAEWGICCL
ncbi:MAG TPA: hypothetical protein VNX88_02920 [Terriglobales bacterium]|nr:hypothetical protein [Terriglobales bacterium]